MRSITAQQIRRAGFLLASSQIARHHYAWTYWNPGNTLPLQDGSDEVWPRREQLHPFMCIYKHTTGAAQKASLYSMLDKAGSMTPRSKSDVRRVHFTDKSLRRQVLRKAGLPRQGMRVPLRWCA